MPEVPDFSGKLLGLYLSDVAPEHQFMLVLESVSFADQAGRTFVLGRVASIEPKSWVSGLSAAVAWDAVGYYVVFDSLDQVATRIKSARPPIWKRLLGGKGG